jgi:DNA-binding NarL/FixJ family response regulator
MNSILIIEDDASYRVSIARILQLEGFDVCSAENGVAGIAMIRGKRPDLILCDIMMPGLDGHDVLEYLKNDGANSDIPFIFVTALNERAEVRRGMAKGADDFLTKPFSAEELVAAVRGRLRRVEMFRRQEEPPVFQDEFAVLSRQITARERQVLVLVGQGATSREISEQLGIRINTVEVHRANLMKKLHATNAAHLARWAVIAEQMTSAAR